MLRHGSASAASLTLWRLHLQLVLALYDITYHTFNPSTSCGKAYPTAQRRLDKVYGVACTWIGCDIKTHPNSSQIWWGDCLALATPSQKNVKSARKLSKININMELKMKWWWILNNNFHFTDDSRSFFVCGCNWALLYVCVEIFGSDCRLSLSLISFAKL